MASRASIGAGALLCLLAVHCDARQERRAAPERDASARPEAPDPAAPPATTPGCAPAVTEKLGVPFVRICPDELPEGVIPAPFWIAAAPLGCSAGEHETIPCPEVVPLAQPSVPARRAALIDAATAHALCMLRFGGRLPTAAERAQAADARGLETVAVFQWSAPDRFALQPVAEWVTEQPCEQISVHAGCSVDRFPAGAATSIEWEHLRWCTAAPSAPGSRASVTVGGECAAAPAPGEAAAAPGVLPCLVAPSSPAGPAAALRFALTCRVPGPEELVHPGMPPVDVAAVRCVLPPSAIVGPVHRGGPAEPRPTAPGAPGSPPGTAPFAPGP